MMKKKDPDIEMLLPWKVNGSLSDSEKVLVDNYLEEHPELEREVAFYRAMRNQVRAEQYGSPGAFGLRRLQNAMAEERTPVSS